MRWQDGGTFIDRRCIVYDIQFLGDFSADGFSDYKYNVVCSDSVADGGLVDQLMTISATVWKDDDDDDVADTDEIKTTLFTAVAKVASYTEG